MFFVDHSPPLPFFGLATSVNLQSIKTGFRDHLEWMVKLTGGACWISTPATDDEIHQVVRMFQPQSTGHELVRLGGEADGGYLVPNDLGGLTDCFSPGVDAEASFERDLETMGVRCHLADRSVESPPDYLKNATFRPMYLASITAEGTITLEQWIVDEGLTQSSELLLQMDIEGAEYEVLTATSIETLRQFRIIVLEMHYLERVANRVFLGVLRALLQKLRSEFTVAHIHPNNCTTLKKVGGVNVPPLLEVTFLRNDRVRTSKGVCVLPHPLDRTNVPEKHDFELSGPWLPGH